jgi:hypothetical protein
LIDIEIETDLTVAELTGLDRIEPGLINRGQGPPDPGEPSWHTLFAPSPLTFYGVASGFASSNPQFARFFSAT